MIEVIRESQLSENKLEKSFGINHFLGPEIACLISPNILRES
jgi:hypothetical protein